MKLLLFIYLQRWGSKTGKQSTFDIKQILNFVYMPM